MADRRCVLPHHDLALFRDKHVFQSLRTHVLPEIAARAQRERRDARCWSVGCASGEEPYTLKILWDLKVSIVASPGIALSIIATDTDKTALERAPEGCYGATSLRELPPDLVTQAFDRAGDVFCVRPPYRVGVTFLRQDLRSEAPSGPFDLVLCRNLAFTYFAPALQQQIVVRLAERLRPHGCLVVGAHEQLPEPTPWFAPLAAVPHTFEKQRQP